MCLILFTKINNNVYLAKNRDRYYITPIKLIRDVINDTEILYILDTKSGWLEGLNEYGIAIINSVLPVAVEENMNSNYDVVGVNNANNANNEKNEKNENGRRSSSRLDGDLILKALSQVKLESALSILLGCHCNNTKGLYGHTIITDGVSTLCIESTPKSSPIIKSITNRHVRTNHTVYLTMSKGGYNPTDNNMSYQSSIIRQRDAKKMLRRLKHKDDILKRMASINYDNSCNSVYRLGKNCNPKFKYGFATTSQYLFDISRLTINLNIDNDKSIYQGYYDLTRGTRNRIKYKFKKNINTSNDDISLMMPII